MEIGSWCKTILFSAVLGLGVLAFSSSPSEQFVATGATKRVLVLGIDGMDYRLTHRMIEAGKLPNCRALAEQGTFLPLQTSMPPLSPVAWTCVQTGMNPGRHGVFDFLVRDPSKVQDGFLPEDGVVQKPSSDREFRIPFTPFVLPNNDKSKLRRKGVPFWDILESHGIPAVVYKMPANYPVSDSQAETLSGMGTPDIEGTYGQYTYITTDPDKYLEFKDRGRIRKGVVRDDSLMIRQEEGTENIPSLTGPVHPYKSKDTLDAERQIRIPFNVYVDSSNQAVAIIVQDQDTVLNVGEWSPWIKVGFPVIPGFQTVHGILRFYLKGISPYLQLFISPIHLAPSSGGLATENWDVELEHHCGLYHTKGMSEQTKALSHGVLTIDEYLKQSNLILQEKITALEYLLSQFQEGMLFFYVSTLDLDSHTMWRHRDPLHPAHDPAEAKRYGQHLEDRYEMMDILIGWARSQLGPDDVLYVLSDHGFTSFRREVNLPCWLQQEGFLVYESLVAARTSSMYSGIDWRRTKAFPVGFNGLCVNLAGREAEGYVSPDEYESLVEEIRSELLAWRDDDGKAVFKAIYRPSEIYGTPPDGNCPDLVLGYNLGFGPSDASALGTWAEDSIRDHTEGFSGHHLADFHLIPGVLFSSRTLTAHQARLEDIPVTVLKEFGIAPVKEMTGCSLYGDAK